jgi:hypothetical protein
MTHQAKFQFQIEIGSDWASYSARKVQLLLVELLCYNRAGCKPYMEDTAHLPLKRFACKGNLGRAIF